MEVIISNVENQHTKTESMTLGDSDISACWQRDCVASVAMTDHTARMAHGDSSKHHLVRENRPLLTFTDDHGFDKWAWTLQILVPGCSLLKAYDLFNLENADPDNDFHFGYLSDSWWTFLIDKAFNSRGWVQTKLLFKNFVHWSISSPPSNPSK